MASRRCIQHSRASEQLVSVEKALEMIHTQGSDVEEDINNSSDENFNPYSEETDVDSDTEVGADRGEEAEDALPAHEPQQNESDSDDDTYMGEEVNYFSWNPMSEHAIRGFLAIFMLIHTRRDYCQWYITSVLCIVNSFCCCSSCKDTFLYFHILSRLLVIEYYISCVFSNSSCARMWCRTFLSC